MSDLTFVEEAFSISKSYKEVIFSNLSLKVPSKGLVLVYGPNGSGKSTLLRVLALHEPPDAGRIRLMGEEVRDVKVSNYHLYARYISYSFQEPLLLPIKVRDNLEVPTNVNEGKRDDLVRRLRLEPLLDKKATKLSGGEKKRVDVARAVMRDTPILIMDEPLAYLDPDYRNIVMDLILEEARKRAVIVSATEIIEELRREATVTVDMLGVKG